MKTYVYIFALLIPIFLYNNCGESFQSVSVSSTSSTDLSVIVDGASFNTYDDNSNEFIFKGKVKLLSAEHNNSDYFETPKITAQGFLCLSGNSPQKIKVKILRYLEFTENNIKNNLKLRSKEFVVDGVEAQAGDSSCANANHSFNIDESINDLKLSEDLKVPGIEISKDQIFVVIEPSSVAGMAVSDDKFVSIPGNSLSFKHEPNPIVDQEEPGEWGNWVKTITSACVSSSQDIQLKRTCEEGFKCEADNGDLLTEEIKNDKEACEEPLGNWQAWTVTNTGQCIDGKRNIGQKRLCEANKLCLTTNNTKVSEELRTINQDCEVVEPPDNSGQVKPVLTNPRRANVLFVGNSYHASHVEQNGREYNGYKIFQQFAELLKQEVPNSTVRANSIGGGTLKQHWDRSTNDRSSARNQINSGDYDVLVIQGRYHRYDKNNSAVPEFNNYIDRFISLAKSRGMKVIIYGLWTPDSWIENGRDVYGPAVHKVYSDAAKRNSVAYIPNSFAYWNLFTSFRNLGWSQSRILDSHLTRDNVHPSVLTGYLVANSVYATMFGKMPVGLGNYKPPAVSDADLSRARDAAWKAVREESYNGY